MKFLLVLISLVIILLGFKSYSMYDDQYTVIRTIDKVEIRQYPSAIYASYAKIDNNNSQFQVLANYIFGGNIKQEKIGMTSPVHMIQSNKKEMLFRMPNRYKIKSLPRPNDDDIQLFRMEGRKIAALRFSGYANSTKIARYKNELINILRKNNIKTTNQFEVLVYDSPYKVLNRRNEIIVVL